MGDGIDITRADGSSPSAEKAGPGAFDGSAPFTAMLHCLRLQSEAPARSFLARLFGLPALSRTAEHPYRGALGELAIMRALDDLGPEWSVVHAVPAGRTPGDTCRVVPHLVVGPAGIFTIAPLNHSGSDVRVGETTFLVDSERLDIIADSDTLGAIVSNRMSAAAGLWAHVTPCVVLAEPLSLEIRQRPLRVEVMAGRRFATWIRGLPRLLSVEAVATFQSVATEPSTWLVDELVGAHGHRSALAEFDSLRRTVERARAVRLGWIGLGVVATYTSVAAALGLLATSFPFAAG